MVALMKRYYFILVALATVTHSFSKQPLPTNRVHYNDRMAKRQIVQLYRKLKAGYAFDKLARTYSQDYGSYRMGGALGWQKPDAFVPAFSEAVSRLTNSQISEPFKTEFGYHIVQLLDQRPDAILTRHILIRVDN